VLYRSNKQPACRFCGAPIAKFTESHSVAWRSGQVLRTIAECQALSNAQVVSVRYHEREPWADPEGRLEVRATSPEGRFVTGFSTWDGESYIDEFFCNGAHAKRFAYQCARKGLKP
jgi:hypothetical protein